MFFSFEKHLIISFATSLYRRFTMIISECCACWAFTLQLISCAMLKKPPKTCLICLDNRMTGIRLKACNCNKADSFAGPLAGCLLAQVRRAIPKLIHPSPIMCLWLEFANIATLSQLLMLLFCLWICLLIWAILRTVRVQYLKKKSLEPTGQIAALLLTGSCYMQSESGSVPCVHCSPFGKLNKEVKATSGVTDNRRPYTSCFMSREG